jgi:polyketide cyclase/dehydrase/lipid transport protein
VPRPRFSLHPVDETFFDSAPFRLCQTLDIPHPAARVWTDLTADSPLGWCRIVRDIKWTSPRPFGVGTTRTARLLGGANVLDERFFLWEEGRRQSFYAVMASMPMFRRLAEDYLIEATSESACRLRWTIALEPRALARPANPANKLLLGSLFRDTRRHYGDDTSRA